MRRWWWIALLVLLAPLAQAGTPSAASGSVHAFLNRSHVSLGDVVTLNIRSSGSIGTPDLSPLQKDFQVLGTSRSRSVQIVNGKTTTMSQIGVALKPLHGGTLVIPPFDVGGAKTQALTLHVGAAPSGGIGKVGDPVFMETAVLSSSPWVGQQTVYTVRLFYLPGVDGSLGDPTADGARLIRLDRDHRYTTERNGYTYKVVERSWALLPQRSGAITVQGPAFQGRQLAPGSPNSWLRNPNMFLNHPNALLNGQVPGFGTPVDATAPLTHIEARAAPVNGGKPWLPARKLQLKLAGLPANGKVDAGAPLTVTLSISADGQPADALPEPQLPPIAGARVYPDQTRDATDDTGQWLKGSRTRSFAIVPRRNGKLMIPAITLSWWNVTSGRAEKATLPAHTLHIRGVVANAPGPSAPPGSTTVASHGVGVPPASATSTSVPVAGAAAGASLIWRDIALASLALWGLVILVAGAWWWQRHALMPPSADERPAGTRQSEGTADSTPDRAATVPIAAADEAAASPHPRALQRETLDAARSGDVAACEHAVLAWARVTRPEITHLGALREALSDGAQREALDLLQRVRWQGGDAAHACAAVAQAFAHGFAWREDDKSTRTRTADLPPLYPSS
ncbi:MAG: BatD family protein [Rhodanobacteraceae bacterium]